MARQLVLVQPFGGSNPSVPDFESSLIELFFLGVSMKVYSITNPNTTLTYNGGNKKINTTAPIAKQQRSPLHESLNTTGAWFAFGVGLDWISRKFSFFKSPMKNSLVINGTISIAAGAVTAYKAMSKKQ